MRMGQARPGSGFRNQAGAVFAERRNTANRELSGKPQRNAMVKRVILESGPVRQRRSDPGQLLERLAKASASANGIESR